MSRLARSVPKTAFSRPALTAAVLVMLMAFAVVLVRLALTDGDVTRFVHAGHLVSDPSATPDGLYVDDSTGYDGQYFFRLALDPLTTERTDFGIRLDDPAFRHQRILYPSVAYLIGWGNPLQTAWGLVLVNIAGLGAISALGVRLALDLRRSAAAGLFFVASPALWLAFLFDTAEIMAALCLIGALLSLRRGKWGVATALMVAGVFARETTLLLPIGLAVQWLIARLGAPGSLVRRCPPVLTWLVPGATYVCWQVILRVIWRDSGIDAGVDKNMTVPLGGLREELGHWTSSLSGTDVLNIAMALLLFSVVTLGILAWRADGGRGYERLAFAAASLLALLYAGPVWFSYASFVRVSAEMIMLATLLVLDDKTRSTRPLLVLPAAALLLVEARIVTA